MIKTVITQLYIAFCLICFFACEKQKEEFPDIRIGKEGVIDELSLNKQTEKRLLLSGGNGKYIVNVENVQMRIQNLPFTTFSLININFQEIVYKILRTPETLKYYHWVQ